MGFYLLTFEINQKRTVFIFVILSWKDTSQLLINPLLFRKYKKVLVVLRHGAASRFKLYSASESCHGCSLSQLHAIFHVPQTRTPKATQRWRTNGDQSQNDHFSLASKQPATWYVGPKRKQYRSIVQSFSHARHQDFQQDQKHSSIFISQREKTFLDLPVHPRPRKHPHLWERPSALASNFIAILHFDQQGGIREENLRLHQGGNPRWTVRVTLSSSTSFHNDDRLLGKTRVKFRRSCSQ